MLPFARYGLLAGLLLSLAAVCGKDDATESASQAERTAPAVVPAGPGPDVEELTADQAFARGLTYHISDVVFGNPPGIVVFQEDLPITFHFRRNGAAGSDVELMLEAEMAAGSKVSTPARVILPPDAEGEASAFLEKPLSMILGVPGAEAYATARLVSTATNSDVSNTVVLPYRVVAATSSPVD